MRRSAHGVGRMARFIVVGPCLLESAGQGRRAQGARFTFCEPSDPGIKLLNSIQCTVRALGTVF
jgi:hypothetical protein